MRVDESGADLVAVAEQAGIAGEIVGDRLCARIATALLRRCGGQAAGARSEAQILNDRPCCDRCFAW